MKKILHIVEILLFVAGVCLLSYPFISSKLYDFETQKLISEYDSEINNLNESDRANMIADANAYNKSLNGTGGSDKYSNIMSDTSAIGYVDIPKINVFLPIYHGSSDYTLSKGIGHMENTSLPVGGESTHCVLTGHTGMAEAAMFSDIDKLVQGDVFYIHSCDSVLAYKVDQIKTVLPNDVDDLRIINGEDHVTLLTCTPYGINTHRLLVRGVRIPYDGSQESFNKLSDDDKKTVSAQNVSTVELKHNATVISIVIVTCVFVLVSSLIITLIIIHKKKNKSAH